MKKIKFYMLGIVLSSLLAVNLTSCINDLNVTPIDPTISSTFDQDAVFTKVYASLSLTGQEGPSGKGDVAGIDEGTSSFVRLIWNLNELSSDEAICAWGDPGVPELNFNQWSASHDQVRGLYARFYYGIALCNHFLEKTADLTDAKTVKQRAEVRYMRALNYYFLMDMFGNVPFTDVVSSKAPMQMQRAELFTWIESELKGLESDLAEPKTNTYYRIDKAANWMLLTRLYLNAAVYTGTAKWNDAAIYAKKVIDSGYKLTANYQQLFMGDNAGAFDNSTVNKATEEIILPIACDGVQTRSWGNSLFLIASTRTSGMSNWGSSAGWGGNRARKSLAEKFFPTGIPSGADLTNLVASAGDDRALFHGWDVADSKSTDAITVLKPSIFKQGLAVKKFSNVRADGKAANDVQYTDTDVPLMRVAEAYLSYAEAVTRGGAPVAGYTALQAVNAVRLRAHAPVFTVINLSVLCDEWSREFFFEGRRRTDLIRFGNYGGSDYTWEWKGGTQNGTKFSANYNLFPIPAADLTVNPNLTQNPGF